MEKRELGHSGLYTTPLVLGSNVFGWTADEATSFRVLDAFVGAGGTTIDTANVYSAWVDGHQGGESETVLGKWLQQRHRRDDVLIATKVGMKMGDGSQGLRKTYIKQAVEASLRRLQTDYIDLYQSHKDDETLPVTEPLEAYAELLKEGKIRAIGASNFKADRLRAALLASQAHGLPRYETLQPEYNLYDREDFEQNLLPVCQEFGLGVISYFGLASGFLTGKYRTEADLDQSVRGSTVGKKYLNDRGRKILQALDTVADRHHATQAEVALAWLMAQPGITAPIASATSVAQVRDLAGAMTLTLSPDDVQLLDETGK